MVIHQNQTSIKVRNEENVKQATNAHISENFQVHIWNQQQILYLIDVVL